MRQCRLLALLAGGYMFHTHYMNVQSTEKSNSKKNTFVFYKNHPISFQHIFQDKDFPTVVYLLNKLILEKVSYTAPTKQQPKN